MARNTKEPVQQYRGTVMQHSNYTGPAGELTVDTTTNTVVVQDGVTQGGHPLAKAATKVLAGEAITVTGGTLGVDNTIAAKIGSTTQRGVLQVGNNLQVSNGTVSSLNWTDETEELTTANSAALSDAMHDTGLLHVSGENATVVGRAIGELVWSLLPIRGAGFQLLDGSLIYSTGIFAAFYNYMVQLKNGGTADNLFITETEWQNSVTTYGVCGKFVLDTTNGTVRIPKVTGHVEGTIDSAAVGTLIEAGLPNITGSITNSETGTAAQFLADSSVPLGVSGSLYVNSYSSRMTIGNGTGSVDTADDISIDASRSSTIYGNSTTVQTQSIKGYMYMVIGTYAKSDLQVNLDNVAADLQRLQERITALEATLS